MVAKVYMIEMGLLNIRGV